MKSYPTYRYERKRQNESQYPSASFSYEQNNEDYRRTLGPSSQRQGSVNPQGFDEKSRKVIIAMICFTFFMVHIYDIDTSAYVPGFLSIKNEKVTYFNTEPSSEKIENPELATGHYTIIDHMKESVMVLSKPYDVMKDVVWDMPVNETDVPVFWITKNSGSERLADLWGECFGLTLATNVGKSFGDDEPLQKITIDGRKFVNVDTTTLRGIERAKRTNLISSGLVDVIVTTDLFQIAHLFNEDRMGRAFAFFRHPVERDLDDMRAGVAVPPDFMTRQMLNKTSGDLNLRDLGQAKKIIKEKVLPGMVDDLFMLSVDRISKYFGWEPIGETCVQKYSKDLPRDLLADRTDGTDPDWVLVEPVDVFDIQVHEMARSNFRAHYQTIIPLHKQIEFYGPKKNEDE